MNSKYKDNLQFDAILAKNNIARMVRDGEIPDSQVIRFRLSEIEQYIGTLNQPSVKDIFEDKKGWL